MADIENYSPDTLIAGDHPLVSMSVTVTGGNYARGTLMGRKSTGEFTISDDAASDGSETPVAILAVDCDASAGDVTGQVYLCGEFDEQAVTYGGNHTADTVRWGLTTQSIYLKKTV